MNLTTAKKYLKAINDSKKKTLDLKNLCYLVNKKEEYVLDDLQELDPMIRMFSDNYNFKNMAVLLDEFIVSKEAPPKKKVVKKATRTKYKTVKDYVYNELLVDNLYIDKGYEFNDEQLNDLRKVINKELKERKGKKK